ncbi:cyclopropane-fatty-acyl-phospholipid synthase family protein [Loktanella sp. SALINAS62]|uniref:SAM-dependent methyltransferase n=1 Tax=Loktanella sp. SALINAS62 TaxID=2706124 RepID=UPI001B8DA9E5|nr:cyclopropane-fatty-acyl-phospholipid synthase family protein [Loktanella sp. SALINAS62]MBS1304007.1 class I SAM-dependent methyltransferase [Loktanella sp. SALINAS62]
MWHTLLDKALRQLIVVDTLDLTWPDGQQVRYGRGPNPVAATLHNKDVIRGLVLRPDLTLGNAYMNGDLTVADDDIDGLLSLLMRNRQQGHTTALMDAARKAALPVQRIVRRNPLTRARANVAHHYDLSSQLYDLFLDRDRQYSCAYFRDPSMSLDEAQEAKKHHIARKLCLQPDMRVLDIGCGWGGMALTLARDYGVRVVGVTLSDEQHRMARARVHDAGLQDRIDIRLQDYRQASGPFDRIVSVGMFEHVGKPHYRTYFNTLRDLLTPDGVALVHTIGTATRPRATSEWIRTHIFPGGYLPALSEMQHTIESSALIPTDIEVLRLHYAYTLRHWRDRFEARADAARALYDERFVRMWRFYLAASERSFIDERLVVFQFQLARDKAAVPITRDYLHHTDQPATTQPDS